MRVSAWLMFLFGNDESVGSMKKVFKLGYSLKLFGCDLFH